MIWMLGCLTLSQRSLSLSSFLLIFSSLLYFHYSFTPLILSSASVILLMLPSRVLFISVIALFIIDWLFFISSRSLLNLSCIFSILVSSLFICNSILFSRFWIFFIIIILNSFSSRFPISSSFVWYGGHLSCYFTCWIFLCLFVLFRLLCLGCPFCRLEVCGSSLLWSLLPVSGVRLVVYQDFLIRGACIVCFGWWSGISSLWRTMKCPVVSFGMSMCLAWLWVACLLMLRAVFLLAGELAWYVLL